MAKIVKKPLPKEDDCGCGRPVKITERKKLNIKRTIKKR
jgi:hypothetical protein